MSNKFNQWLEPYRRSFSSIKSKLLQNLDQIKDPNNPNNSLITDKSEGNILVWILSQLAAIAEGLHYYIDQASRESFLPTASKYESIRKHAELVDYNIKGAIAATVEVYLTRDSNHDSQFNLNVDSVVVDGNSNEWRLLNSQVFPMGSTLKKIVLTQCSEKQTLSYNGKDLVQNMLFLDGFSSSYMYMNGSMEITVGDENYVLVESLAKSKPTDPHFKVEVWDSSHVVVVFGDNLNGKTPSSASLISCTFRTTKGIEGNIGAGSIDTTWPDNSYITVKNNLAGGGGSNYEDFETLKRRIPLSIKTLDVAITKEDFRDLAMTRPGIGQAAVEYECGRKLNIYIANTEGEPASDDQCTDVENYILQHCPLTTWVHVKPVGKTNIILDLSITGRKSYKKDYIHSQVVEALTNKYSAANSEIGGSVRLSDIYALIDNLSSVDYLRVNKFYLKPWPKVSRGIQLEITTYNLVKCDRNMEYILEVNENQQFNIYSKYNGYTATSPIFNLSVNDTKNGIQFTMVINNSDQLVAGYKYSIYITQNSLDYEEPGYNIPAFDSQDLHDEITEVL